jgi:hypothetical protein
MINHEYWLKKRTGRKTGFPLGTLAYYGKDDTSASKAVAGIWTSTIEEDCVLKNWFSSEGDLRKDKSVTLEIIEYFAENKVERVSMFDRIFGCPHEEEIDYAIGEKCPECSFWANRDRLTGELLADQ